jgi:hypothetical protein
VSPLLRRALKLAAWAAVVIAVAAFLINTVNPPVAGPEGSSYATDPGGLSAYLELLHRAGHPVTRVRSLPAGSRLDPASTVILLDPTALRARDIAPLRRFVIRGGVLLAGGSQPGAWLAELLPDPPAWQASGPTAYAPPYASATTAGVGEVLSTGDGSWSDPRATLPVLGQPGGSLVDLADLGAGRIELLADASPLENQLLAHADNAALGLALAGLPGRPVAFEEGVHGYGVTTGLAALPTRWKWALLGLLLAALAGVGARFRRLADPDPEGVPAMPPRRAHVDALALALGRSGPPGQAAATIPGYARGVVRRRAGLDADATPVELAEAAARFGLDDAEIRAVTAAQLADEDVVTAGRALAKLSGPPL